MDFLAMAFYSRDAKGDEKLSGAMLTQFDEADDMSRPSTRYVTRDELVSREGYEPAGFSVDDSGVLFSDTSCRKSFDVGVSDYIGERLERPEESRIGIIDAMLAFCVGGCSIVQNYNSLPDVPVSLPGEDDGTAEDDSPDIIPCCIPAQNFKVSSSSFNIYAPYKNSNGKYRTLSLIDIQTEESPEFYVFVPNDSIQVIEGIRTLLTPASKQPIADGVTYKVMARLYGVPMFMGEGFINYLAFNVAFYQMGLKIVRQFLKDTKYVYEQDTEERGPSKKPRRNVEIKSILGQVYTDQILRCIGDPDRLARLVSNNLEADITLRWIQLILSQAKSVETEDNGDRMRGVCLNLQHDIKSALLRYSLELLAQRYYLAEIGPINDQLPEVLKGGGVGGCATKGFTW